ncbi:MAG: hypothetical protein Q8862_03330 [Bacteroidota bacterium]|nr:hypothetical protein [Bacteroidota bacterium]MDP4204842.1 hypothetical protein [Bacteroidota bacterium]
MSYQTKLHSFHIPVLGTGYTLDTPVNVAHFGISSVISVVDDVLIEKMREMYSKKFDLPFQSITDAIDDFRAKRITAYLNLVDKIVKSKFEELKATLQKKSTELEKFIDMLPDMSTVKQEYLKHINEFGQSSKLNQWIQKNLKPGSIDINIMTKLDKENYKGNDKLPIEYNDAHAALRGFALSDLESSIVLSAGMNPRLSSYFESFEDFYPTPDGYLKKQIIIKVSDYRSALIQGKFFAKKGLWVSEYRIESGLNCGGHAFATDGYLMGPILEEFKNSRESLLHETFQMFQQALKAKNRPYPETPPEMRITAQGGVGTSQEHDFLLENYNLDSIGWGTPFLLVPEATNVDEGTLDLLCKAKEEDLYLSGISPLGVPFNSVRNNSKGIEKEEKIRNGKPGAACIKKYLALYADASGKPTCTASRTYQRKKIQELQEKNLSPAEYEKEYKKIVEKECLCLGLAASTLKVHNIPKEGGSDGVTICPGPNLAYFSRRMTLKEMIDHIYGRINVIERTDRPNLFVKELSLYVDNLKQQISNEVTPIAKAHAKRLETFKKNLFEGIAYYKELFFKNDKLQNFVSETDLTELAKLENSLKDVEITIAL